MSLVSRLFGRKPSPDADHFFLSGEWVQMDSSNVAGARYRAADAILEVAFKNGSVYAYSGVSGKEAILFHDAPSKGTWVWDNLRVRGSKTDTRKTFARIA